VAPAGMSQANQLRFHPAMVMRGPRPRKGEPPLTGPVMIP
jgi:hypothetical protein